MSFGSTFGWPLAYWLADIALRLAGGHMIGVYLLAQICIVTTYWAVFQLGRTLIGQRQAVLAIMLMVGISVFTVSSPDFGPDILMMPLWALALLFLWRAMGQGLQLYWLALAASFVLMLLAHRRWPLLLLPLVAIFLLVSERGRHAVMNIPALAAAMIVDDCHSGFVLRDEAAGHRRHRRSSRIAECSAGQRKHHRLDATAGACGRRPCRRRHPGRAGQQPDAHAQDRRRCHHRFTDPDPFARLMVYYFALVPLLVVMIAAVISGKSTISGIPPLLVLSGLAIVVAAGDVILVHHQRILNIVWFSLLLVPPVLAALGVLLLPTLFAADLTSGATC